MIYRFQLIPPELAAEIVAALEPMETVDGRLTAGPDGQNIKRNRQVPDTEASLALSRRITEHLSQNILLTEMAGLKRSFPFRFSRHDVGAIYGDHTDNGYMGTPPNEMRIDLSMTVFLSDPASYDGGELVINADSMPDVVKLPAGGAVLYSGDTLHRVNVVTRGCRWAAITWFESRFRMLEHRALNRDLTLAESALRSLGEQPPGSALHTALDRVAIARRNFLRLFGE